MAKRLTPEEKEAKLKAEKEAQELERKAANKAMSLKDLLRRPASSKQPIFNFKVGDLVKKVNDNIPTKKIVESLHDGTILFLEGDERYISHMELIPEEKENEISKDNFSYRDLSLISFHNTPLSNLLHYYYGFGLDMSPVYQRELVWELEDKQSLIHSIFSNIEIGKFVLIDLGYKSDPSFEVLDGKQRINALTEFLENRFQYRGKYYYQLSYRDKNHFRDYNVTLGISREDSMILEQKMMYFLKMNTQGKAQSKEHLNKVLEMLKNEKSKKS